MALSKPDREQFLAEPRVAALSVSAGAGSDTVLLISADASARHQSVVTVMEAARKAGLTQITFATQAPGAGQNPAP